MNKKELAEIKRQFSPANCAITRICGCYVDAEKTVKTKSKDAFLSLPEEEMFKYFDLLKKTLSGSIGKNLIDMEFPLEQEASGGTQEDVLSLISGGFDSGVSSYMLMRRGCRVHYCFFNLGGAAHEIGVRQVAHYLWNRFGSSHRVRFVAINFEPVVGEILEKIDDGQMGVILKRMMVRAASKVAERYGVQALVTGEALGQVSSQTLTNLRLIDNVSDTLILRPLISYDKEHIINLARQIGTEDFARTMPEYCGVISKSPTVKAVKSKIEAEEEKFDFSILDKVVEEANNVDIREIAQQTEQEVVEVETVNGFGPNTGKAMPGIDATRPTAPIHSEWPTTNWLKKPLTVFMKNIKVKASIKNMPRITSGRLCLSSWKRSVVLTLAVCSAVATTRSLVNL